MLLDSGNCKCHPYQPFGNSESCHHRFGIGIALFNLKQHDPAKGDVGAIDATLFNAKTRAALSFYAAPNGINSKVNALYYIGDENRDAYEFNEGSDRQKMQLMSWNSLQPAPLLISCRDQ